MDAGYTLAMENSEPLNGSQVIKCKEGIILLCSTCCHSCKCQPEIGPVSSTKTRVFLGGSWKSPCVFGIFSIRSFRTSHLHWSPREHIMGDGIPDGSSNWLSLSDCT